jgi:membrane fusion protein (multidrug efflux system)
MRLRYPAIALLLGGPILLGSAVAQAQMGPGGPPAVGVSKAALTPIFRSSQYVGRVTAINRVALQARVTGYLQERNFKEGSDVKKGQVLFIIEQPPYQAAVLQAQGAVAQAQAQLRNSRISLGRSRSLLNTPAGQQSNVDSDTANAGTFQGQLMTAQAQLQQAEINLGYTTVAAPIDGRIGLGADPGNVVSASTGALATIVSQDPEYVTFPVSELAASQLVDEYAGKGGLQSLVVKLQLPDGKMYDQTGKIDFSDISVSSSTILADQQGDYVFVVGADNKVSRRNVTTGDTQGALTAVMSGLKEGETVVADGVQRVKPGAAVKPIPYTPPNYSANSSAGGSSN